ncbi:hypothetical protein Tco_1438129 [Tanacetum coccineum]
MPELFFYSGIVDQYLANKMKEAVDVAIQLNLEFTPQIEKLVNEQLESEVLVRSSKEAKTSHAVAANLLELELKKIVIDKMEANKSISRPRDGADDDQEPSAGTDRGSKRRRSGKDPESTSAPREKTTTTAGKTTTAPAHQVFETGVHDEQPKEEVHPLPDWFQQPKQLPSPDRAWNKSYVIPSSSLSLIPDLEYLRGGESSRKSYFSYETKLSLGNSHWAKAKTILCISSIGGFSLMDDDILYKFKEGDFHRLRIQDIEDMLLLLVQGKVTILNVEERIAFNDETTYTPYSDPIGFIYENKDKKNRLMCIDELHKFSDGTLDDVQTALNDRLKGIRMKYLPQTFWSQRDKANARAMIQAMTKSKDKEVSHASA